MKMKKFTKEQIEKNLDIPKLILQMERGFVNFSEGKVIVPSPGHLHFESPPGDLYIKYGNIKDDTYTVVKIASYFSGNYKQKKKNLMGLMLVFSQKTGEPLALLEDEGYLTNLRTAIAGAICAKHFAPRHTQYIGIIGAGMQARMQLQLLSHVIPSRKVWIWARREEAILEFKNDPLLKKFQIQVALSPQEVASHCQLIVTTTSATNPLLFASDIKKGTHITAVGADRPEKQELDPEIFAKADLMIVDSRKQCFIYGETSHALKENSLKKESILELGEWIDKKGIREDEWITISDLTGVAIQDIVIATHCYENLTTGTL